MFFSSTYENRFKLLFKLGIVKSSNISMVGNINTDKTFVFSAFEMLKTRNQGRINFTVPYHCYLIS